MLTKKESMVFELNRSLATQHEPDYGYVAPVCDYVDPLAPKIWDLFKADKIEYLDLNHEEAYYDIRLDLENEADQF